MWGHMGDYGMMGSGMGFAMLVWWGFVVWGVIFSILVVQKLNIIIRLLERK